MGWIKAFISLALFLVCVGAGLVISVRNSQSVNLDIVVWSSSEYPLGLLLLAALLVGCLLGVFGNSLWVWQLKRQGRKLQKQLDGAVKRFDQLQ
jgi:uncharacterized integral membrane protein